MGTLTAPIDSTRVYRVRRRQYTKIPRDRCRHWWQDQLREHHATTVYMIEGSYFQAAQWLDIYGRNGIVLNPEKFVFSAPTVHFAGFTINMTDVRQRSRYLEATRDFPEPRNITDVSSWFRLVNQVAYAFSMPERMHPFRKLLKMENASRGRRS